jgi:capsular exopolysaccharide synthesis family protein
VRNSRQLRKNSDKFYNEEAFRILRNNIEYSNTGSKVKSLLMTSTKKGEGKTMIASKLALIMAKSGKKTLLVDCDFNNPSVHKFFNINNSYGLLDILQNDKYSVQSLCKKQSDNLSVLPWGLYDEFSEVFIYTEIGKVIKNAEKIFDFIIIDAPSVIEFSSTEVISQYVDGCILVVGSGYVEIEEVKKVKEMLLKVNANILGAVLNKDFYDKHSNTVNCIEHKYEKENENTKKTEVFKQKKKYFNRKSLLARILPLVII